MTRKQIGGACGAILLAVIAPLLLLALLHGADNTAQAQVPDPYEKVSMPDFGQHSKNWCWVAAASNSFWWFAQTGDYPELMDPVDKYIEPLSRDATPAAPDLYDPHDLDGDTVTNEPDGVPDWFDYNDRPEGTGLIYDGTCGDYADNDGDNAKDFLPLLLGPPFPPPLPDPDCTSPWLGGAPPQGDDDGDGSVDEDPINDGVDEDGDSLVDEDPIDFPPFDDDGDGLFDEDPPAYDDDGDGSADEDGVVGYRTLLKRVAETVWRDTNQNGIRDANERSYVYSEAVEKWDYLIGLQAYIDDHGADLQVHDLLHPNYTGKGWTPPTDENQGAMSWSRPSQLTAQAAANSGVGQVVRIPTLDDYKTELSRCQDVLVWMCRNNAQGDLYCHVVTGQGYDTTDPDPANHFITVSDPWTHDAAAHDDTWLNKGTGPDHNNDYKHDPEPYDDCDVVTPGSAVQDFAIDCGGTQWTVIDLIFISPPGPDVKILDWGTTAPSPIELDLGIPEAVLVEEVKHNNGPGDPVTATATWTAISSDPAGLGVNWVPKAGDLQPDPGTLEFEVTLPDSVAVIPDRFLELTGYIAGSYSVTLINEEWPVAGYDRDPSNNVATTTIFVNVGTLAGSVDKAVTDIIFDDALLYPDEGTDIGNEWWVNKSENVPFSVTSEDVNLGPDEPTDAEISFYMDVPAGCSARWYDPAGHFPFDIQTIDGDENQMSSGTVWFPPAKEAGPVRLDLHFQTAEYGLYEPVGDPQRYTRFFEIHCYGAGDYVFTFCNRADPKFDTDPDPLNNLLCEELTVHSLHNADIKVLNFYSEPEGPFTFDVSTYNIIDLIENKHNNGPQDAWSSVYWSMDPIEDRNGDGIPDINVRWEAIPGDLCTYQGVYVPCGEGDVAGLPSITGDNCQDDMDNDGDNTCDINGCTAFPGMGDPDCQDIDDIEFYVDLPVSAQTMVSRPLKLHCKNDDSDPYTLTLYNEEWPVNPEEPHEPWEDPDPENNFQQLDIDVICQADPHYKCYDIYDATAPSVGKLVTLEDQFHTQTGVEVTYPQVLCPPAIKYVDGEYAGGGTAAPHLKCYSIVGMPDANVTVNLTTQFGTETDIDVGMAGWLCIPADKEVTFPEPVPPQGFVPLEPHYVCYDIWPAPPPPGLDIGLETQFGIESSIAWEPLGALCAPALKNGDGDLTAPHLRCYTIDSTDDPPHIVNLFTQFDPEYDVDVKTPWAMCVPAEKEIVAEADVKILSQTIYAEDCMSPPPTDINVSEDVVICVDKVLHNNGPYGPVSVDIVKTASAPPGCSIDPLDPPAQVVLEHSVTLAHQELYLIHCDEASTHGPFTIDNVISIKDPGITDPDPLNNVASSTLMVNAWAYVDIQILDQQILESDCLTPLREDINVSEDLTICVLKYLHNAGSLPVSLNVTKTTWASAGAEITPPSQSHQVDLWPLDVVAHFEYFTIHCSEPCTHWFTVDNTVTIKDAHIEDPDGAFWHSEFPLNCLATTDIKITSQSFLDPPAQMTVGVPELVTLRKQLHNNGGYGPATVDIDKTAYTNSPNATIAPPSDSAQVDLPVSTTIVHDEDFTLNCSAPGIYTYTVDNDVTSKEPHISGGDFESTDLIVECVAAPTGVHYAAFSIFGDPLPVPPVDLETQFGEELGVEVGPPVTLMAPALKNGEGTLDATHLKCYDIASSEDPFHLVDLTTQFGLEEDVEVGPARELCMPAAKEVVFPEPIPPGPLETEPHYKCYEITGPPLGILVELVTQFFSPEPVVILDVPTRLCAPALKNGEPGNLDDYPHLKCYDIPPGLPTGYIVNLETQFGFEFDVEVGEALRLCMPAVKDLVCQPGAIPPVDTDGDTFTDDVETYLPTDCLDDCTDNPGVHDAWPLDINMDKYVTVVGDVLAYAGRIGAWGGPPADPNWMQRLDLGADNYITVVDDVLKFSGKVGGPPCT